MKETNHITSETMKTTKEYIFQEISRKEFEKKYPGIIKKYDFNLDEFSRPVITGIAVMGTDEQKEKDINGLKLMFQFHELNGRKNCMTYMCKVGDIK